MASGEVEPKEKEVHKEGVWFKPFAAGLAVESTETNKISEFFAIDYHGWSGRMRLSVARRAIPLDPTFSPAEPQATMHVEFLNPTLPANSGNDVVFIVRVGGAHAAGPPSIVREEINLVTFEQWMNLGNRGEGFKPYTVPLTEEIPDRIELQYLRANQNRQAIQTNQGV